MPSARSLTAAFFLAATFALSACSDGGSGSEPLEDSFRIVLLSDPHVIGPQYDRPRESEGVDNASILKTPDRFLAVRDAINAMRPRPEFAIIAGDITHAPYGSADRQWYRDRETAFSRVRDILDGFEIPVHLVFGNHDYEVDCDVMGFAAEADVESVPREMSHALFDEFFDAPPTKRVEHGGWKFILANSQLGPTWEAGGRECDTSLGSYGAEQLAWIDSELAEGKPSMVFFHHPLLVTAQNEQPGGEHPDLFSVLRRHRANLVHSFAGHTHRWIPLSLLYPVGHTILGATRYDPDNFWVLELGREGTAPRMRLEASDPDALDAPVEDRGLGSIVADPGYGEFDVLDLDKAKWFSTCARPWIYDEEGFRPSPDDTETGDCAVLP